jgi:predicted O-methyltransferase YrrM
MNNILNSVPDKTEDSWTTSLKFKEDLIKWCGDDFKNKTCLEIGTHKGYTARILSHCFGKVLTIDNNMELTQFARKVNSDIDNINYFGGDIYSFGVYESLKDHNIDVVFIDAIHKYPNVLMDTINSLITFKDIHIIYDDYGFHPQVKKAIDDCLELGIIEFVSNIGEPTGYSILNSKKQSIVSTGTEGIICKFNSDRSLND